MPIERRIAHYSYDGITYAAIIDGSDQFIIFDKYNTSQEMEDFIDAYRNRENYSENNYSLDGSRRYFGDNVFVENGEVREDNVRLLKQKSKGNRAGNNEIRTWTAEDEAWYRSLDNKYSMETDSEGKELSESQRSFFKDSKAVDENGNLKVYYHGARGAGFTVFDPAYSDDGISLFFSDSLEVAKGYSGTHEIFYPDKPMTFKELNQNMKDFTYGEMYAKNDGEDVVIYEIGMDEDNEVFRGTLMEAQNYFIDGISDVSNEISANYASYLNIVNPSVL